MTPFEPPPGLVPPPGDRVAWLPAGVVVVAIPLAAPPFVDCAVVDVAAHDVEVVAVALVFVLLLEHATPVRANSVTTESALSRRRTTGVTAIADAYPGWRRQSRM